MGDRAGVVAPLRVSAPTHLMSGISRILESERLRTRWARNEMGWQEKIRRTPDAESDDVTRRLAHEEGGV